MTRNNVTWKRGSAMRVAAALCLCVPSVASFSSLPSSVGNVQSGPASMSRLQVSISTGPVQVGESGNEDNAHSALAAKVEGKENASSAEVEQLNWDWKAVMQEIWKLDHRDIVLFDGECNLCNGGVNMLLDMDTNNELRFCSLSSNFGKSLLVAHGKRPDDNNNIIMVSPINPKAKVVQSTYLQKSEAVMAIASKLAGAPHWVKAMTKVGTVAPAELSDWFLQIIADNRHKINISEEYDQCRLDFDGEYDGRFLNDYEHEHLFEPIDEEKIRRKYSDIIFS